MNRVAKAGVSAMSAYVPPFRVRLQDWCEWTGNSWDKIQVVVGRSFRVPGRHENVYTMAANAVLLNGTVVPSGALAAGVPAMIKEGKARTEHIDMAVQSYVNRSKRFRDTLRRID